MARGKTLLSLLDDLRVLGRLSLNPAHNNQTRDHHVRMLQMEQEALYDEFTWPHLRVERKMAVQANERYYDPPSDMHIDRIERIEFRYGLEWLKLTYGIDASQYSMWNSDLGIASWPVARWRRWNGNEGDTGEQIELWPIPAQNGDATTLDGYLKFIGIRNLAPLVDDADRADLDDQLIVLPAAIKILASSGQKDAQIEMSRLQRRYDRMKARLSKREPFGLFQGTGADRKPLRGPPRVAYRTTT